MPIDPRCNWLGDEECKDLARALAEIAALKAELQSVRDRIKFEANSAPAATDSVEKARADLMHDILRQATEGRGLTVAAEIQARLMVAAIIGPSLDAYRDALIASVRAEKREGLTREEIERLNRDKATLFRMLTTAHVSGFPIHHTEIAFLERMEAETAGVPSWHQDNAADGAPL